MRSALVLSAFLVLLGVLACRPPGLSPRPGRQPPATRVTAHATTVALPGAFTDPIGPSTTAIPPSITTPPEVPAAESPQLPAVNPKPATLKPKKKIPPNPFSGCDMCHVDSVDELVVSVHHTEEKIGCVKCHGKSDGHISDENNEVKPDRLFPPDAVDKFCGECHECDRPKETQPKKAPKDRKANCTDCHHPHNLKLTIATGDVVSEPADKPSE